MSVNTIERIFWELCADPAKIGAFLKEPDGYLSQFQLTEDERKMVRKMDVKALEAHGVSNMLLMIAFSTVNGGSPLVMFDYLKRLNGGRMINRMKIPAIPFRMLGVIVALRNLWVGILSSMGLKKRLS